MSCSKLGISQEMVSGSLSDNIAMTVVPWGDDIGLEFRVRVRIGFKVIFRHRLRVSSGQITASYASQQEPTTSNTQVLLNW